MKILFLEDADIWAKTYKIFLKKLFDCEILHLEAGDKAFPVLDDMKFDLIICDHYMPGATGEKVYYHARHSEKSLNKDTVFIHHTSMPCPNDYGGASDDLKFICCAKDGDVYNLFCDVRDSGFEAIRELPDTREILRENA